MTYKNLNNSLSTLILNLTVVVCLKRGEKKVKKFNM